MNLCLSVCLSVCLCMCVSNISADQDQTDLRFSLALSTIATVTCAPEPITAVLKPTTHLKKQAGFTPAVA